MEYRNLGRSGLKVSPLCLGTMMLGRWGNTDEAECVRIVHRALDAGINFIDTSNNYGEGSSEEIVGKALRGPAEPGRPRDEGLVAGWARGRTSRGSRARRSRSRSRQSLRRLGTDVIDLYQIHRPDRTTPWEETLSTLTDLVRQGKVRYIGCSTSHCADPGVSPWGSNASRPGRSSRRSGSRERHGFERWISLQPPYSILRRTMEAEHFPVTQRFGIGNIVWSPLEGGWLTGKYRRGRRTRPTRPAP